MKIIIPILVGILVISGSIYAATSLLYPVTPMEEDSVAIGVPPSPDLPAQAGGFVPASETHTEVAATSTGNGVTGSTAVKPICGGSLSADFDCYEQHYVALIASNGISAAFDDLKTRYAENGYVKAQCHPLTHVIGRTAAKQFETVGEAYEYGDGYCWSGYYHGVLETFIDEIGLRNLPTEMDKVCANIEGEERYSFNYYNCVHGLGHGVMAATQTELFQSLALCDNLTGLWEESSCASGAYMENVIVDGLNHKTKYLDPARPLYPCNESPEKYKQTCYLMQTSYMLKINSGDFKKTFEWCRDADGYENICWQSLGRDASGRSASDVLRTKATCLLGENFEEQSNCAIGAVKDFISYFHSDKQAKVFCNSFDNSELTSVCLSVGETYYRQF